MDTPPSSRRQRYEVKDEVAKALQNRDDQDSHSVPRSTSRRQNSLMHLLHGEEDSNVDRELERQQYQQDGNNSDSEVVENAKPKKITFKRTKNHGMMWPWHPQQVSTWITFLVLVTTFYLILLPGTYYIHLAWVIAIAAIYGVLVIGVIIYASKATLTDPTDRNVVYERQCRKEGVEPEENEELEYFCDVCEAFVHDRTKHWGDCNRWVDLFDHHCKWLNNCIGGANYADFLTVISILLVKVIVFIIVSIILIITAIVDEDKYQEGNYKFYDTDLNRIGIIIYVVFCDIVWALIVFFTTSLILLHIRLYSWGLTAYEYIVYQDEQEERLESYQKGNLITLLFWHKIKFLSDHFIIGEITKEEYIRLEQQARDDIKKKKKSSIITQIKKENKASYRQQRIAENKKIREQQKKEEEAKGKKITKFKKYEEPKGQKKDQEFTDIGAASSNNNPKPNIAPRDEPVKDSNNGRKNGSSFQKIHKQESSPSNENQVDCRNVNILGK